MSAASRSRRPSSRARRSRMTSDDAVKKRASILRSHASMHSAEAMCVLPVLTSPHQHEVLAETSFMERFIENPPNLATV